MRFAAGAFTATLLLILTTLKTSALADEITVDAFLTDVQKVLVKVRDASDVEALPTLKSVRLVISAELEQSVEGSLRFHVLEAGADLTRSNIQRLTIEMEPPRASDKSPVVDYVNPLADAIISVARDVKKAASRDPPLHLTSLEASIEFTVEKQASGTLAFVGAKSRSTDTQNIVLQFSSQ